jgi:hypothetical protein
MARKVCFEIPDGFDFKLDKLSRKTIGGLVEESDDEVLETPLYEEDEVADSGTDGVSD